MLRTASRKNDEKVRKKKYNQDGKQNGEREKE